MQETQTSGPLQSQDDIVLAIPPEPKLFYYILSFLVFPIGVFLGIIYLRKDGVENITFGTRALIAGGVLPGMLLIIGLISLAILR